MGGGIGGGQEQVVKITVAKFTFSDFAKRLRTTFVTNQKTYLGKS
jgi:hypothetical protein